MENNYMDEKAIEKTSQAMSQALKGLFSPFQEETQESIVLLRAEIQEIKNIIQRHDESIKKYLDNIKTIETKENELIVKFNGFLSQRNNDIESFKKDINTCESNAIERLNIAISTLEKKFIDVSFVEKLRLLLEDFLKTGQ